MIQMIKRSTDTHIMIMINKNFTIKKVDLKLSSVVILWNDKQISHFHFLWLRDNCISSFHPDTRMRNFNILSVSENIHPKKCYLNKKGNLVIKWSENNHESVFLSKWLRDNCYTIKNLIIYGRPV